MLLYYTPGACSLASHIALTEAGAKFGIVKVNLKDKTTETGKDFTAINPKGYVLGYISSELHKQFSPLFRPGTPEPTIQFQRDILSRRLAYVDQALQGKSYLTGEDFTVADSYLFTILNWTGRVQIDLTPWPNLRSFIERVKARPAVQSALGAEGLLKPAA